MLEYKVDILNDENELEAKLNEWAAKGWRFNSMESEYRTNILIFERETNG